MKSSLHDYMVVSTAFVGGHFRIHAAEASIGDTGARVLRVPNQTLWTPGAAARFT